MKATRALRLTMIALIGLLLATPASPESPSGLSSGQGPLAALVDQLVGLFPKLQGEVIEVRGSTVTLDVGVRDGARAGLEVNLFRAGREIRHPRTDQVLGRVEEPLGKARLGPVGEILSVGNLAPGVAVKPGDRFRVSSEKVHLVLLPLLAGVREGVVEAATQQLLEGLAASGRFRVSMGDTINAFLAERGIKAEDFLGGKGVNEASIRFKAENMLAVYFKRVQNRPFIEVRFFSSPEVAPLITTEFFVPRAVRVAPPTTRFSHGGPADPPAAKPRSLLARLLGSDLDVGSYSSSSESAIPLRQVARFDFPVLAMDIAVEPRSKIPRMVVSDGDQVYMYRIEGERIEPEWTKSVRSLGRVFSLQLADLYGDGNLQVLGNRYDPRAELNSFILAIRDGRPTVVVDNIREFLFAVDLTGQGVKQTLWVQRYSPSTFFTPGQADQVVIRDGKLVVARAIQAAPTFRPMGAAFSNVAGRDTRAIAFIDEHNRLRIVKEGEELWRSATPVGGGPLIVEQILEGFQGGRSKFYKIEPTPLAVDLDGDGIEELVVPQNVVREGLLAVVFKGPAGFRLQSVNSGFEGIISALGAYKTDDAVQPTMIAAVVRFSNFLKVSGETQVIMTIPQE